jgi:hypothetical protein
MPMFYRDQLVQSYGTVLDSTYDCVDRIVLRAYFPLAQTPGGFRFWWRKLMDGDTHLDTTHLMRFAARFSRRIHAYCEKNGIPLLHCQSKERKYEIAADYLPTDSGFRGVFCVLVGRAPAPVFEVKEFDNGSIDIRRKRPYPYVNHYYIHIMDADWGHIVIRFCPHPPFNAKVILNGHEYIARQASKQNLSFIKEGNCFSNITNAADFSIIADTMIPIVRDEGRLVEVCERWLYSACLCFALNMDEQQKSDFRYSYSVYQAEYSRNLLFYRGKTMEAVFQSIIDRTRSALNVKTIKTIFGYKHRPFKKDKRRGKGPKIEVVVERPVYDLTIFKVHFGKLTVKIYSKGERVLRVEVIAHNTEDLRCGKQIEKFSEIIEALKQILERFTSVLNSVDVAFIDSGTLESWPAPSTLGATRISGVDVNKPRIRAVMEAVIALSINQRGFSASQLAEKVREILKLSEEEYSPRQAAYDLKKLRGKQLVERIENSRRYQPTQQGLKAMNAFLVLREKVLLPLLAGTEKLNINPNPKNMHEIDTHYKNIQHEMKQILNILNFAA